jgi:hypothetical protein
MKAVFLMLVCILGTAAADFGIKSQDRFGALTVTNAFTNGVVSIEKAASVSGPWTSEINRFSTNAETQLRVTPPSSTAFFRALALDLTGLAGFANLVESYSLLTTVAGGRRIDICGRKQMAT